MFATSHEPHSATVHLCRRAQIHHRHNTAQNQPASCQPRRHQRRHASQHTSEYTQRHTATLTPHTQATHQIPRRHTTHSIGIHVISASLVRLAEVRFYANSLVLKALLAFSMSAMDDRALRCRVAIS